MRTISIQNSYIRERDFRLEGKFYLNDDSYYSLVLEKKREQCKDLSALAEVFNPPVFKRQFCNKSKSSVQYFQSSDVPCSFEISPIHIQKKQAEVLNLLVKKNDILVTGFGTIGNVKIVSKHQDGVCFANNVCRIRVKNDEDRAYIYAFFLSKYARAQLNKNASGSVVRYIEAPNIKKTLIPNLPVLLKQEVSSLIQNAVELRESAWQIYFEATNLLFKESGLGPINCNEYNFFGQNILNRPVTAFSISRKTVGVKTINAFNHSIKNRKLIERISSSCKTKRLIECIDDRGFFSTGSFPRNESKSPNGIVLINQSDIFNSLIKGKRISKKGVKLDNLVKKDEVIIAGVGTLGENETFCRCTYANDFLVDKLISGEFIRMKPSCIPPGYLYLWLSSDYGFRLIRSTQTGTKLCRPILKLLEQIPVPILEENLMGKLNQMIIESQNKFYQAVCKEIHAVQLIENEIDNWKA